MCVSWVQREKRHVCLLGTVCVSWVQREKRHVCLLGTERKEICVLVGYREKRDMCVSWVQIEKRHVC